MCCVGGAVNRAPLSARAAPLQVPLAVKRQLEAANYLDMQAGAGQAGQDGERSGVVWVQPTTCIPSIHPASQPSINKSVPRLAIPPSALQLYEHALRLFVRRAAAAAARTPGAHSMGDGDAELAAEVAAAAAVAEEHAAEAAGADPDAGGEEEEDEEEEEGAEERDAALDDAADGEGDE